MWNIRPVSSERGTTNLSINLPHLAYNAEYFHGSARQVSTEIYKLGKMAPNHTLHTLNRIMIIKLYSVKQVKCFGAIYGSKCEVKCQVISLHTSILLI